MSSRMVELPCSDLPLRKGIIYVFDFFLYRKLIINITILGRICYVWCCSRRCKLSPSYVRLVEPFLLTLASPLKRFKNESEIVLS